MGRSRCRLALVAVVASVFAVVAVGAWSETPAAAAVLQTACPGGSLVGSTYTLAADCNITEPLTVPDGFTLDGGGHTIAATDAGGTQWNGALVTNAGTSMNVQNVMITGPAAGFQLCTQSNFVLYGIWFNDASGTVNNVTVDHIFQQQNGAFGSCQTGRAIRADGGGSAHTVTITNTTVMDYQKSGFEARGSMTMDVSNSTAGPPHSLTGLIAQNAVTYVGAAGTVQNNTLIGSGDQTPGVGGSADGTGVLLFGADHVTVDHNTITGAGTDIGIAVTNGSTNITLSFNQIGRTTADNPDPTGHGIDVGDESSATLICNTFSNWNINIVGAIQIGCTPLPDGTECTAYAAHTPNVEGGTAPFTWSLITGSLPPGLTLADDGTITGTPTQSGTFDFTLEVVDANGLTATSDQRITIAPDCAPPTTTTTTIPASTTTITTAGTTIPASTTTITTAGTTTPAANTTSTPPTNGTLPFTGSSTGPALLGITLLLAGAVLLARTRHRH